MPKPKIDLRLLAAQFDRARFKPPPKKPKTERKPKINFIPGSIDLKTGEKIWKPKPILKKKIAPKKPLSPYNKYKYWSNEEYYKFVQASYKDLILQTVKGEI